MMKTLDVESSPPDGCWLRMAGLMPGGWRSASVRGGDVRGVPPPAAWGVT
jgi:hypothetical protein